MSLTTTQPGALVPNGADRDRTPVPYRNPSQTPALVLEAPRPRTRGPVLIGFIALITLVGGLTAWSVLAPLAEAAIAPGIVKVEGTRRTIQHFEGGIVREIVARDGDRVRAGDVLMRLDSASAASQLETLRSQRWSLVAQDARLTAELAGAKEIAFPHELLASDNPRATDAVSGQRALFEARAAALESQLMVLRSRIDQQEAVIASANAQRDANLRSLELLRLEERNTRTLLNQGLARLPQLLALQRNIASTEGNIEDLEGQMQRARATIEESERQIRQTVDTRLQEASTELRDVRQRLAETEERLRAAADVSSRLDIVAPEEGVVVNSRFFTVGAVIRAGEPVMDLVPLRDRLIAEVNVQPNDIDVVHPGLEAEVRLPAFKQRVVPHLHGHVTYVASDVTMDERTNQSYYRVHIQIDEDQLAQLEAVELRPGMSAEALIRTGERSFARYLIQPVLDSFHRAFREQ